MLPPDNQYGIYSPDPAVHRAATNARNKLISGLMFQVAEKDKEARKAFIVDNTINKYNQP